MPASGAKGVLRPRKTEWSRFFCPEELCASPVFSWQRLSCQADSKIHGKLQRAKNSHARNRSRRLAEGNVGTLTRSGEAAARDGRGGEARPRSQGPGRAEAHCGASPVSGLSPKEKNKERASTLTPRHARIGSWQVTDLHVKVSEETGENVYTLAWAAFPARQEWRTLACCTGQRRLRPGRRRPGFLCDSQRESRRRKHGSVQSALTFGRSTKQSISACPCPRRKRSRDSQGRATEAGSLGAELGRDAQQAP